MQRNLRFDSRGGVLQLLLRKSELAVKRRADRTGTDRVGDRRAITKRAG